MTDLTPNDLSHMSDEDFNALCPQGHHALGAEPLSHAAQAVLDAAINTPEDSPYEYDIAAALRAAADQFPWDQGYSAMHCSLHLQAIAEELENQ